MSTINLEILRCAGLEYLIDAIGAAVHARIREENYRVYLTDSAYLLCASFGNRLERRYYELTHPTQNNDEQEQGTGEDIAVERLERFGIKVVT